MFCPNCGVKLNTKMDNCPICGVNLKVLEDFGVSIEEQPKKNFARLAVFSRSLKKRSSDIDSFIKIQKQYLNENKVTKVENNKDINTNSNLNNPNNLNESNINKKESVGGSQVSQNKVLLGNIFENSNSNNLSSNNANLNNTNQNNGQSNSSNFKEISELNLKANQNSNNISIPNQTPKDEFNIPKINSNVNNGNINNTSSSQNLSNKPAPLDAKTSNQIKSNLNDPYLNEKDFIKKDEFNIPKINQQVNPNLTQTMPNGNANEISNAANKIKEENDKKINDINGNKKGSKRSKRRFFGVLALILSILAGLTLGAMALIKFVKIDIKFLRPIITFFSIDQNVIYFIWGILGTFILSIIFSLLQLMIGGFKFSFITFIFVLLISGGCVVALYFTGGLMLPIEEFISFIKNLKI